jgi:phosphoenolpyruvate synthase/pyruvate phosphate dikinase
MSVIVWFDAPDAAEQRTGGKGLSLIALHRGGFPVPPGFVVAAEGYERFVAHNGLDGAITTVLATPDLRLPKVAREACSVLDARLATSSVPADLADEVSAAYNALRRRSVDVVAVRSSALSEDGTAASSAGLYESYLNLRDADAVVDALRRCYTSLWTPRAVQYRAFKNLNSRGEAMAVVVMALIPAVCSGVAFTANPVTGNRGQIVINASWGLGEAVVAGRVTPDSFVLDSATLDVVSREIYEKGVEIVPDPSGGSGTVQRAVDAGRAHTSTLSDVDLRSLGALCRSVEQYYGRPMDVEWASTGDTLYVLQARPITGLT